MKTPTETDIWDAIADLQRRLSDVETMPQLGDSAIDEGALIARDAAGFERARFGQLLDGTFGVTGRVAGSTIEGSNVTGTVIAGSTITGGKISGSEMDTDKLTVTSSSGGDINVGTLLFEGRLSAAVADELWLSDVGIPGQRPLNTWITGLGPDITGIPVQGGTLLVIVSTYGEAGSGAGPADATMSYQLTDAGGGVVAAPDRFRGVRVEWFGGGSRSSATTSFVYSHSGLAAGNYSVRAQYFCGSVGGTPHSGGMFKFRSIHVFAS